MKKETIKLYFNQMTLPQMYKIFGLKEVRQMKDLDSWLSDLPELTETEKLIAELYQSRLVENIKGWNEQELSLGFIGPIMNLIHFKVDYKINFFAQRQISNIIGDYELMGKPDGTIAGGHFEPETPYFNFQEYKKDINSSGDPAGQNLAAMLVGQSLNKNDEPIYGCYIVGSFGISWFLKGNEYIISRDYSASHDDIYHIVKILKKLKHILFERLDIEIKE